MARKKKEEIEEISQSQVWDVLEFARKMNSINPGLFTPDLVNARLKDVNMNPLAGTSEDIERALKNPKNSEKQLREFSQFFEYTNLLYKRILAYLANILSFDLTYTCINAEFDDYKSKAYKKDLKIVNEFLDKFDYKNQFKKTMRMLVRQDTFFTVFRTDSEKYLLQELPIDYAILDGQFEYGYTFSFDMTWFINNQGVNINMYPPIFKKLFKRVMDVKNNGKYDPAVEIGHRNGTYVYKIQVDPMDGFWAFKFNQEQIGQIPYFSPMFSDLVNMPLIRNLQRDKYIIAASKVLIGLLPLLKDNKSGNVKDMMAISPEVAGQFANLVRQGLAKQIQFGIAPFEDVKSFEFKSDNTNLLEEYNTNTGAVSGINTRLLYSIDKQNIEETRTSISVDEQLLVHLYSMFNNFLDFHINRLTKKYKFKFTFEGTEFPQNRKTRLEDALKLLDKGIVLPQKISAAIGMNYTDFQRQLDMARAENWTGLLTPVQTSYTLSKNENSGGRPQKPQDEIGDNGAITQEQGSNLQK